MRSFDYQFCNVIQVIDNKCGTIVGFSSTQTLKEKINTSCETPNKNGAKFESIESSSTNVKSKL